MARGGGSSVIKSEVDPATPVDGKMGFKSSDNDDDDDDDDDDER